MNTRVCRNLAPAEPFWVDGNAPQTVGTLIKNRITLLKRIAEEPELVKHYPHAKRFLEATPEDSTELVRVNDKAAMDKYILEMEAGPINNLLKELQEVRDAIPQCTELSDQAKSILIMATFIPRGRSTSYTAFREWVRDVRHVIPDTHIVSALKKCSLKFDLQQIPMHRIVERNGAIGVRSCD